MKMDSLRPKFSMIRLTQEFPEQPRISLRFSLLELLLEVHQGEDLPDARLEER